MKGHVVLLKQMTRLTPQLLWELHPRTCPLISLCIISVECQGVFFPLEREAAAVSTLLSSLKHESDSSQIPRSYTWRCNVKLDSFVLMDRYVTSAHVWNKAKYFISISVVSIFGAPLGHDQ